VQIVATKIQTHNPDRATGLWSIWTGAQREGEGRKRERRREGDREIEREIERERERERERESEKERDGERERERDRERERETKKERNEERKKKRNEERKSERQGERERETDPRTKYEQLFPPHAGFGMCSTYTNETLPAFAQARSDGGGGGQDWRRVGPVSFSKI
jgi:hypothetical protein